MATQIFVKDTLNLFCDASIQPMPGKKYDGCSGCVPVIYEEGSDKGVGLRPVIAVLRDCTNNIAELTAIQLGVEYALQHQLEYSRINLFSDSQISVFGLRDWIWGWAKTLKENDYMVSSSGEPVANQVIIMNIINLINCITTPFNIYHQKGHAVGKYDRARKTFFTSNKINLLQRDVISITDYNDIIDRYTRDSLLGKTYTESDMLVQTPFCISPPNIWQYYHTLKRSDFK